MKYLFLVVCMFALMSCASTADRLIAKVPAHEFDSFEYRRGGGVSSAEITAYKSRMKDGELFIESMEVIEDAPFINFHIKIEGLKMPVKNE